MTYFATPQHKKPCPGGHEIYNFGRVNPSLVIIDIHLAVCSMPGSKEENFFMKYIKFYTSNKIISPCEKGS